MTSAGELIQFVIDTIDNASSQKLGLTELLDSLTDAKLQVTKSAEYSRVKVKDHFAMIQKRVSEAIQCRMSELLLTIDDLEKTNLEPLAACEDMIQHAMTDATTCMDLGKAVLENNPDENVPDLLKFKETVETKHLNIFPEVPSLNEVAYIEPQFHENLCERIQEQVSEEGYIHEKAPVQITETLERPGMVLVKWEETEDELDAAEFRLQYCNGRALAWDLAGVKFHTVYTGEGMSHSVKHLKPGKMYSFRVSCRPDKDSPWGVWSVPRVASTRLPHYEWDDSTPGYSTSNENKTGTRVGGLTRVLYSKTACYKTGFRITFKVLDAGEKSPLNGIGIAVSTDDIDTMKREGTVFMATDGTVYVDGQEMKTKLPGLSRNSCVTMETEPLSNGKVRICMQVEQKELTFDWKIDRQVTLGLIGGLAMAQSNDSAQHFHFAMIFSHEDWKVSVE